MKALIDCGDDEEADDLILAAYQEAKAAPPNNETTVSVFKPLYPGDDVYVGTNPTYKIQSHETRESHVVDYEYWQGYMGRQKTCVSSWPER